MEGAKTKKRFLFSVAEIIRVGIVAFSFTRNGI